MLLRTVSSTFMYFEQAEIVARAGAGSDERTTLFAYIDLAVSVLTLLCQMFLTGRLIRWFGVGLTLALLPLVTGIGFIGLAFSATLAVFVVFQALDRAANYAVSRPTREVLFTVVTPEEKYKSKSFIDTAVYRGGDVASAWLFAGLRKAGLSLEGVALVAAPLSLLWVVNAVWLGRRQKRLAEREVFGAPAEPPTS